jgi:hypothetical protein
MIYKEDSRHLLSMLNGDHVWNEYVKKNMKKAQYGGRKSKAKVPEARIAGKRGGAGPIRALQYNIMDVKQLLFYTKDRLDFL